MAAQSVNLLLNTPYIMCGTDLGNGITYTYTAPTAGIYRLSLQTTYLPNTGLTVTVKQNGSTVYTMPTPAAPFQSASQFYTDVLAAAADVLTVNLTSSVAEDALLNTIQTTCQVMNNGF
jgi:hypothetical protein